MRRALSVLFVAGVAIHFLVASSACEGVPDIHFVGPDGSSPSSAAGGTSSGTTSGTSGGGTSGFDASSGGTSGSNGGADASSSGTTCTAPQPAGGVCCGEVWCVGKCASPPKNCTDCAGLCPANQVCCADTTGLSCKSSCP
jgi:hypothetical protein